MSKRFGRRQKKKLTEKLARQEEFNNLLDGLNKYMSNKLSELNSVLEDAYYILEKHSSALPVEEMGVSGESRGYVEYPKKSPAKIYTYMDYRALQNTSFTVERLQVLLCEARYVPEQCGTHVRVRFGDGAWGYALSSYAIETTPEDILTKRIAVELATMIARDLKRKNK